MLQQNQFVFAKIYVLGEGWLAIKIFQKVLINKMCLITTIRVNLVNNHIKITSLFKWKKKEKKIAFENRIKHMEKN